MPSWVYAGWSGLWLSGGCTDFGVEWNQWYEVGFDLNFSIEKWCMWMNVGCVWIWDLQVKKFLGGAQKSARIYLLMHEKLPRKCLKNCLKDKLLWVVIERGDWGSGSLEELPEMVAISGLGFRKDRDSESGSWCYRSLYVREKTWLNKVLARVLNTELYNWRRTGRVSHGCEQKELRDFEDMGDGAVDMVLRQINGRLIYLKVVDLLIVTWTSSC